ncbi:MAG: MAPEG family protein [Methylobacteriaceae bacterium]|nr:MAPEG family protein [Methylobacteriaceae bacterium]
MSLELKLLGWSVVLLLVQIVLQAASATSEVGLPYAMTSRDDNRQPRSVYAGRFKRALGNLLETYPAFVALALGLVVSNKAGGVGAIGAELYLAARVLYLIIYAAGISVLRTLIWALSIIGLVMMLVRFLG